VRSLSYILTGRPRNRADCIDYARAHPPRKIMIELMVQEDLSEAFIAKTLFATYVWVFEEMAVTYQEAYGRCFQHEAVDRQRVSVDNANRRLEVAVRELRERVEQPIEGAEARFDYGAVYQKT